MRGNIQRVRPGMRIVEVSAKTGQGMNELLEALKSRLSGFHVSQTA
jgi:Ni2+-binding GTPase involved in maturation of urease and hydrogenase